MRCLAAAPILALVWVGSANATEAADRQSVETFVAGFVDEVNKGDTKAALGRLATDVSIAEDLAPFHWKGPQAGADWLTGMQKNGERLGMTDIQMRLGAPIQVLVHGATAYEAIPGVVTLTGKRRKLRERGMLTFTLARQAGAWKITSLAWGGAAAK